MNTLRLNTRLTKQYVTILQQQGWLIHSPPSWSSSGVWSTTVKGLNVLEAYIKFRTLYRINLPHPILTSRV